MNTKQLINYMKLGAPGWDRTGGKSLLGLLNEAQNILLRQELAQRMFRVDGEFPYLQTTDGVYEYDADNSNIPDLPATTNLWRIGAILYRTNLDIWYNIENKIESPSDILQFGGKQYYRLALVTTDDRVDTDPPKIKFSVNPGDTTEDYFVLGYIDPIQMTTETIQPEIPEVDRVKILLPTANKLVEAIQNNTWGDALDYIDKYFCKKIRNSRDGGEQGVTYHSTRRRM